jgi:hypothetical protein
MSTELNVDTPETGGSLQIFSFGENAEADELKILISVAFSIKPLVSKTFPTTQTQP